MNDLETIYENMLQEPNMEKQMAASISKCLGSLTATQQSLNNTAAFLDHNDHPLAELFGEFYKRFDDLFVTFYHTFEHERQKIHGK